MASQQLYSYLGRAGLWKNVSTKLANSGTKLAPCDARALKDLCAGVTWMQRVPPALLASYRALYVILRGEAAEAEDEINRDIMRTVRGTTGLLLDVNSDESRNDFAGSINRVLNALAHVDDMGYCQGQNYVVDVMMKAGLPERETFCLFLYLLRQGHFHGMYRKEVAMLAGYMDKLEEKVKDGLPELSAHFEEEQYPPPLYALEWITTFFGLAAQPLVSLVALDLFLAGARNPVLRLCVSLLGEMEGELLGLDQEGLLKGFRSRALNVGAERVIVRALTDGGKGDCRHEAAAAAATTTATTTTAAAATTAETKRPKVGDAADRALGWSTGPDYLLVLRCRNSQTLGLVQLREESKNALLLENTSLQDALLAVTRSMGWGSLRTCWLESCLAARSDRERHSLASQALRFVIVNGGHAKAAAFMLGVGGADANAVDSRLVSPLHLVALFNRPDIARILLMCGASPRLGGGVARSAVTRGKLWSPLDMAEEACTEGGALDEAGVAVGPAALFVLRGLVCLQCNVKLPKLVPCGTCKLKFCKSCQITHCCIGRLPLPRGVAEASSSVGGGGRGSSVSKGVFFGSGSKSEGAGAGGGRFTPEHHPRWELGSAIGDDWEALFSEKHVNARGSAPWGAWEGRRDGDGWKPGGLRRVERANSKAASVAEELGLSSTSSLPSPLGPWSTMRSVWLGTWERRPQIANAKDRDKLLDNSATFVRACFPAQAWLQYHMEEEMGLTLGSTSSRHQWGGSVKGLGIDGEHFNPEIMQSAGLTELHRRMSWVMAEAGVPWEENDDTWCCPECFILYSLNVFRHHCRGCGQVFCSAHAPPTPVPNDDRPLKLCWSCVLEGAVPLPDSLLEDEEDEDNQRTVVCLSPNTARRVAEDDLLSPTRAAGSPYVAPQHPSPDRLTRHSSTEGGRRDGDDERQDGKEKKKEVGILSALVSLIEVVATPTSPGRTRGGGGGGAPDANTTQGTKGPPARPPSAVPAPPGVAAPNDSGGGNWRGGWTALPPSVGSLAVDAPPDVVHETQEVELSPLRLRKEYDSGSGTRTQLSPLRMQKEFGGFSSLSTAGTLIESGDDYEAMLLRGGGALSNTAKTGAVDSSSGVGVVLDENPVELGFPSERPWALGFGP